MEVIWVVFHTSFQGIHNGLFVFSTQVLYIVKQSGIPAELLMT